MDLADKIAIENLVARYARCVDQAEYEELGRLFADGRITADVRDQVLSGEFAVREFYATTNRTHADGTARTHHIVTNLEYRAIESERVALDSCFTVFQCTESLPLQPIVAGRYQDVFVKSRAEWRFESKHIIVAHIGNLSEHLTISLAR
jgi:3-phenylpropionate/cinnamic acid dioxygenase small subunit